MLRFGYVLMLPSGALNYDEPDYVLSAQALLEGLSFEKTVYYHVPPVVPILYAGVFVFTGPSYLAARIFQCLLFLPIGYVCYLLGREIAGPIVGLITLFFGALYPYFIFFTGYAMTETIATLLISASLFFALRSVKSRAVKDIALFGCLLALATLTRAAVIYFILATPLIYGIGWGVKNLRWIKATLIAFMAFLVCYLPWVAVNYYYFQEIIPAPTIGSGVMLYKTAMRMTISDEQKLYTFMRKEIVPKYYYPPGGTHRDRLEGDKYLQQEGKKIIAENLDKYPRIVWFNFKRFWQFYPHQSEDPQKAKLYMIIGLISYGIVFPFFIIGAVVGLKHFRALSALYGFIVYFTLVHIILYGKLRYRIPMDPLILALAASGLAQTLQWGTPNVWKKLEQFLLFGNQFQS